MKTDVQCTCSNNNPVLCHDCIVTRSLTQVGFHIAGEHAGTDTVKTFKFFQGGKYLYFDFSMLYIYFGVSERVLITPEKLGAPQLTYLY